MTTRDVQAHIADVYQVEISPELVSTITDSILPELRAWGSRPLDSRYPIIYLDAITVKVRTDAHVINRPVYVALGIDLEGAKHVLGLWMGKGDEGAKYWLGVLTEIRNRGVNDVCIVCTDGLTGFADAIETPMARGHRAHMCGAPDPQLNHVLRIPPSQSAHPGAATDVHCSHHRRCPKGVERL